MSRGSPWPLLSNLNASAWSPRSLQSPNLICHRSQTHVLLQPSSSVYCPLVPAVTRAISLTHGALSHVSAILCSFSKLQSSAEPPPQGLSQRGGFSTHSRSQAAARLSCTLRSLARNMLTHIIFHSPILDVPRPLESWLRTPQLGEGTELLEVCVGLALGQERGHPRVTCFEVCAWVYSTQRQVSWRGQFGQYCFVTDEPQCL